MFLGFVVVLGCTQALGHLGSTSRPPECRNESGVGNHTECEMQKNLMEKKRDRITPSPSTRGMGISQEGFKAEVVAVLVPHLWFSGLLCEVADSRASPRDSDSGGLGLCAVN